MTKELIIVVGLPGSGKSYLIKQRFSDNNKYIIFDDYKAGAVLDCSNFCFSRHYPELIRQMKQSEKDIVVTDIDFCDSEFYSNAKEILEWWIEKLNLNYRIRSKFLKNEPEKCRKNVMKDNKRDINSRISMIDKYSLKYNPANMKTSLDEILEVKC